jgi:glutaminyl-tRNA synthetase
MPTISGLRRRGYTPKSIRQFSEVSGISKRDNVTDVALLEYCVREDLNAITPRVMAVLNPLKLEITNYPEDKEEWFDANYNDYREGFGSRKVPFSKEIYIEQEDFKEEADKRFFRLKLGGEVRLKNAYIIKANEVIKDENGKVTKVLCTYEEATLSGSGTEESKRKVKGTLHWVSAKHAVKAEVRLYDRLFVDEAPDSHKEKDFTEFINPNSLVVSTAFVEPSLQDAKELDQFQFQRLGYFNVDKDSTKEKLVFNRTVALKDSWAKKEKKQKGNQSKQKASIIDMQIGRFTGKYLKAREEEERIELITNVFDLSEKVTPEELLAYIKKAKSNKEFLTALMVINSEKVSLNLEDSATFETVKKLLGEGISMKNSYVRFQAVDAIGRNLMFKDAFIEQLKQMQIEDKNTHVVERLKTYL